MAIENGVAICNNAVFHAVYVTCHAWPLAAGLDPITMAAHQVLGTASPAAKAALTHRAWNAYVAGDLPLHVDAPLPPFRDAPARPVKPQLVTAKEVSRFSCIAPPRMDACACVLLVTPCGMSDGPTIGDWTWTLRL